MVALKQAIQLKQAALAEGTAREVYVCYTDLRLEGKGYEEFYRVAKTLGVRFVKGTPSELAENGDGSLTFTVYDNATAKLLHITADLVVLVAGVVPRHDAKELATLLRVARDDAGFLKEAHPKLRPLEANAPGIFLAGCAQAPKDIPDTVAQASGAAMKAVELFESGALLAEPYTVRVDELLCNGCGACVAVCAYQAIEVQHSERLAKKVAVVNEALCQGCGACTAACRPAALQQKGFEDFRIAAQLDTLGAAL